MKKIITIIIPMIIVAVCCVGIIPAEKSKVKNDPSMLMLMKTDTDASIQIYIEPLDIGMGTSVKTNKLPRLKLKSTSKENFTVTGMNSVIGNDALDSDGKSLASMNVFYAIKAGSLQKLNKLVKNGVLDFNVVLDSVDKDDMEKEEVGSREAPDPKKFVKLRIMYSYIFTVKDSKNKQFPIQVMIETFREQ